MIFRVMGVNRKFSFNVGSITRIEEEWFLSVPAAGRDWEVRLMGSLPAPNRPAGFSDRFPYRSKCRMSCMHPMRVNTLVRTLCTSRSA